LKPSVCCLSRSFNTMLLKAILRNINITSRRQWKASYRRFESTTTRKKKNQGRRRRKHKRNNVVPSLMDQFPGMSRSVTRELEALKTQRRSSKNKKNRPSRGVYHRKQRKGFVKAGTTPQDPTELANRKIQGEINSMPRTDKTRTAAGVLDVYKNNFAVSLTEGGVKPNIKTINLILSALHHSSDVRDSSRAMYFWGEMKKNELEPNSATYSEMIKNLTRLGIISTAFEFYNEREIKGLPSSPNDPHILLRACARIGEFDRADGFIEKYMSDVEDHSNYVLSNMVNSLLELADGAAYHGHMDRLRRYNNRLVEFASLCPESDNVVKWRPVLNVIMRGLVLAVQYDDVDAAIDMLRIKSKIPEKGLRHNGLFSIFLDEDDGNDSDDNSILVDDGEIKDDSSAAPPPLQLERDVVRSLLYLAARNGSSELAEEALSLFSQYGYDISESDGRAYLQAKISPYRSGDRDLAVQDIEIIINELRAIPCFEFNTSAVDDIARCFPNIYAVDKFFYELTSLNESRKGGAGAGEENNHNNNTPVPAELPITVMRASFMFEDAERVLETIHEWNNICGENLRREAIQCVLHCTELLEKEAAETIHESGVYTSACEVARERMNMCVSESLNLISKNEIPVCEVVGSALAEAYARLGTVERAGRIENVVENKDFDSVDRLLNVLSEMRQSEHELDSRSLRMLVARAEAFRWTQVLDHPTVSEYKSKISDDLLSSDDIF